MIKKVLLVFGTRPEAIKMAPLVKALQKQSDRFKTIICVTGQHREMLDQVLKIFNITPNYDLNIMKPGQDLYDITSRVILGMRKILQQSSPDLVLVHGDTTTSTASAIAAFYQQIPVGHVEAGLRTYNIYSPWPEEINRQLTSRISTINFSPTSVSANNLIREGIDRHKIIITGNTVIDALYWVINKINSSPELERDIQKTLFEYGINSLNNYNHNRKLILITGHRRENFGTGFHNICWAIKKLAINFPDTDFIYPVHLNPNVKKIVHKILGKNSTNPQKNIILTPPLNYLPFVYLMNKSYFVLTDSGGIQEEAPGLGKPVLVMRKTTERPEAIDAGTVLLTGTDKHKIINEVSRLLTNRAHYYNMSKSVNPYGDGKACKRIIASILTYEKQNEPILS